MLVWIDAQLSPALAPWLAQEFGVDAVPVRALGLRDAEDSAIFAAARAAGAVVLTKDSDFVALVERLGAPPLLAAGESLVELSERLRQGHPRRPEFDIDLDVAAIEHPTRYPLRERRLLGDPAEVVARLRLERDAAPRRTARIG